MIGCTCSLRIVPPRTAARTQLPRPLGPVQGRAKSNICGHSVDIFQCATYSALPPTPVNQGVKQEEKQTARPEKKQTMRKAGDAARQGNAGFCLLGLPAKLCRCQASMVTMSVSSGEENRPTSSSREGFGSIPLQVQTDQPKTKRKRTLVLLLLKPLVQHLDRSLDSRRLTSDRHELLAFQKPAAQLPSAPDHRTVAGRRQADAPARSDLLPARPRPAR